MNTALNRTTVALLTNKSGGDLNYGDVVVLDNTNDNGFTTTTTAGLSTRGLGVIIEPNGIANNATGLVAVGGWCPIVNLNTAATVGQFLKTHTVAGQATPHSSPQVEGDFGVALQASATPEAILFGSANGPTSGATDSFKTIAVSGQSDVVADSPTDTLTLVAGANMTVTTDAATDTITFASSGGGGSAESLYEFDDFLSNIGSGGNVYKFTYLAGSNPSPLAPVASHPGIARLSSTGGNTFNLDNTPGMDFLPADTFTLTWVVRPNGHANADYYVGAYATISLTPNDAIFVRALSSDTNWKLATRNGGTETLVDTGVAISDGTWYKITIYRKDASTIGCTVNAGSEVTSSTNVPTAALGIMAGINVSSGTQTFDLDFWSLADTISARY